MAVIAFIAADLAVLRAILSRIPPPGFVILGIPNPGLVIMVLVLEVGLFRMVSQRGAARTFWLGFEVAGWTYVVACSVFAALTDWRLARSLFEGYVLRRPIGPPSEMIRLILFVLFACGLQLLIPLATALIVGILARWTWKRAK